jgi:hypothetical protein
MSTEEIKGARPHLRSDTNRVARRSKGLSKAGITSLAALEQTRADIYTGLAQDLDHEAGTLREMR